MKKMLPVAAGLAALFSACGTPESDGTVKRVALNPAATVLVADSVNHALRRAPLMPLWVHDVDDRFLILRQLQSPNLFRVLSLPDLKPLYDWGDRGDGPDEFTGIIPSVETVPGTDQVLVHDILSFKVHTYSVTENSLDLVQSAVLRCEVLNPIDRPARVDSNTFFVAGDYKHPTENWEHAAISVNNPNIQYTFGEFPPNELEPYQKSVAFLTTKAVNTRLQRFAAFYQFLDAFKIFDLEGNPLHEIFVDGFSYEKARMEMGGFTYRRAVDWDDEHIYTLGTYRDDQVDSTYAKPSILEVWDWDGNSVYRASFGRRIDGFTVSTTHRRIYAISNAQPDWLYSYPLPDFP